MEASPGHFIPRTILANMVIDRFVVLRRIFDLRSCGVYWDCNLIVLDLTVLRESGVPNNELPTIGCHAASEFASMFISPSQQGYISRPDTAGSFSGRIMGTRGMSLLTYLNIPSGIREVRMRRFQIEYARGP